MTSTIVKELVQCGALHDVSDQSQDQWFKLKSGVLSPYYIDMRRCFGNHSLMSKICKIMAQIIKLEFDNADITGTGNKRPLVVAGVPSGAIPWATYITSVDPSIGNVMLRKGGAKKHGQCKLIEGNYTSGDPLDIVLIEDVTTTGGSAVNMTQTILCNCENVNIIGMIVIVDRGGCRRFTTVTGIPTYHILSFRDNDRVDSISMPIHINPILSNSSNSGYYRTHREKFRAIVNKKGSRLIFSADLSTANRLLNVVEQVGPYVCGVKLHLDVVSGWTEAHMGRLKYLAHTMMFVLISDDKYSDIGRIVLAKYENSSWGASRLKPDFVTVQAISGPSHIRVLKQIGVGVIVVVTMSSKGSLTNDKYAKAALHLALVEKCDGVVSQKRFEGCNIPVFTPGIKLMDSNRKTNTDGMGQQYRDAASVRTDFYIVGSGIYNSDNPRESARRLTEMIRMKSHYHSKL